MISGPGAASNLYVNIFGMKEQGKTTLLRQQYAGVVTRGASGTFIDPTNRNADLAQLTPGGAAVRSLEGWWSVVRRALREKKQFNVVINPERITDLSPLFKLIYEVGNCLLAIDEAEKWASSSSTNPELDRLINWGRNRQVSLFSDVRTPPQLNQTLRGNADVTICFKLASAHYAKIVAAESFHHSYPRAADLIVRLPRFHYLQYRNGQLFHGVVKQASS